MFFPFHYNWLFYHLNSLSIILSQKIFNLDDLCANNCKNKLFYFKCFVVHNFHKSLNIISDNKIYFF